MPLNPLPDHRCKLPKCDRLFDQKAILPHDCVGGKVEAGVEPVVEKRIPERQDKHFYEYYTLKGRGFGTSGPTRMSRWLYLTELIYCPKCRQRRMQPDIVKVKKQKPWSTAYQLRCDCKNYLPIDYAKCVSVYDLLLKDDEAVEGKQVGVGGHPWMEPVRPLNYEPWRSTDLPFASQLTRKIQLVHRPTGNDVRLVEKLYKDMGFVVHVPTDAEGNWIKDFTAKELHQRIEDFVAAPFHKNCESAWIFLVGHGAANRAGHPVIGWVNPADGDTYVEPVFELLEHLKVLGSGLQIEKCQRFFMTVACSGGKSEVDWDIRTAKLPPPGTAAVIERLESATTARSSSVLEVARGCCSSRQRARTDPEASSIAPDSSMLHTSGATTAATVAGSAAGGPSGAGGDGAAGPSGAAGESRFMDAVKTAIEKFGAGELSPGDRQMIDARLQRDPNFSGLVEITKTDTDEETSSSGTLCGFAAVDGFMGIQAAHSLYLVELDRVVRDPQHHAKSITDLLEIVGRKVRAHRYYDVEAKCVVRQTTAYLSRLHRTYRLPPFRSEGPPPTTTKQGIKRKQAEKTSKQPPSKMAREESSDSEF